jgi:hypothetical protein
MALDRRGHLPSRHQPQLVPMPLHRQPQHRISFSQILVGSCQALAGDADRGSEFFDRRALALGNPQHADDVRGGHGRVGARIALETRVRLPAAPQQLSHPRHRRDAGAGGTTRCGRRRHVLQLSEKIAGEVAGARVAVGLDPARYAGHSLRAGLATSAAAAGASERVIMSQTGHRSADMVRKYIREGNLFTANPAGMVGL